MPKKINDHPILYEMQDGKPFEMRMPAHFPLSDTPPLFEGNVVSQPIPVCKEGVYYKAVTDTTGNTILNKVVITKDDLEAYVNNSTRDVPLNIDHERGGLNYYGWVRTKTGIFKVDKDTDGRWALFAQVEVTPETLQAIEKGYLRDFSPEIRPHERRFVGLALTNYPVMQELHQFSVQTEEDFMTVEEFTQHKQEMEQKFAELKELLASEQAARKRAEAEAKAAKLALHFSDKVSKLIKDENGDSRIPPAVKDAVLSLYMFAAQHDDVVLSFSEDGKEVHLNAVELLDKIFFSLPSVRLYKQETPVFSEEQSEEVFGDFDVETAKRLARQKLEEMYH